ncbi:gluconokinase [Litchfieldella qijiaojingensis]|uniref:Gluconokinase n=1 Tax=Litchfieldella qijiaojingensis TaxID=980347 RepID=A0ABQ2YKD3_9GAMM|nr:gluconokinase [Halomonas qijiaojingensis]GGX87158.1 gluconokinase [Halomonas qijiaojingensis]
MNIRPKSILVMGVSGSGKSHIGRLIAERLHADFIDADDHHSATSIAKMSRGEPLNDSDREDWLQTLAGFYRDYERQGKTVVIGCSALKHRYRDVLRSGAQKLNILYLHGDRDVLLDRLRNRRGHFFHGDHMLDSQLSDLQPPNCDEATIIDVRLSPKEIVDRFLETL